MGKKKIIILSIISALLILCMFISVSYGYYVISSNEQKELPTATSTPACIGLTITNSTAFTLEPDYAVPITDDQFLNSKQETKNKFKYTFTVNNDCEGTKSLNIGVAPLTGSTLAITNLKYVLVESSSSSSINKQSIKQISDTQVKSLNEDMNKYLSKTLETSATALYNIDTVTLNNKSTKSYDLYMWISDNAGNDVMNQTFKAAIVLDNVD